MSAKRIPTKHSQGQELGRLRVEVQDDEFGRQAIEVYAENAAQMIGALLSPGDLPEWAQNDAHKKVLACLPGALSPSTKRSVLSALAGSPRG